MKTIVVVHDKTFSDVDKMMSNIDYVASTSKTFEGDFTVYCDAESPLAPILESSGLPFSTTDLPEEPDTVISFVYNLHDGSDASLLAMKQWQSRRPVYSFQVLKP